MLIVWTGFSCGKSPVAVDGDANLIANGVFMRTISALALSLVLIFSVTGCANAKIAVVDPARLFQESAPGKAGIEHLKQLEAAMQEQLKTAQGMVEKAPNDEALRARVQKTFVGYQQLVNAEQQKVLQKINGLMQKTLEDYRAKKGYSAIMNTESLLAFDPQSDVTKEVIEEMNRNTVSFEPVKLEPITAAAPADAKTPAKASEAKAAPKADVKPEKK